MIVTDVLWMVILFLIPGMVSFTVYRYVAGYAIDKLYKFILYSTIWAVLAYGIVEVIGYFMYGIPIGNNSDVWIVFGYKFTEIPLRTMFYALAAGSVAAFFIGRLMRWIRLNYAGLLHVKLWDYYVNFLWKEDRKVEIYDYKNNYKYVGNIESFSYFSPQKEIVLRKAKIYSMQENDGKPLSENKEIYIQLEDSCFSIVTVGKKNGESKDTGKRKKSNSKA